MNSHLSITKHGSRYWAVWLGDELLAVTVYKKGAKAVAQTITQLSTLHGKEVHYAPQAA